MKFVAATKSVVKADASVASNATHSLEIDTLGYAYASIDVALSSLSSSTAATVLRVAQSDASGSGQVNIPGCVGGTDFTVAAGSTTGGVGYVHRFDIDLRGKSRYLTVYCTPSTTVAVTTVCRLAEAEAAPVAAATKNVNSQAVV